MRVINDKEEETRPTELGLFSLLAHAFLVALGMASIVFGPLPMILAHLRLTNPWPKLAVVLGAVLALTLFEMSPVAVVILFVFGLFVADAVERRFGLWQLMGGSCGVALGAGGLCLVAASIANRTGILACWTHLISTLILQVQQTIHVDKSFQWELIRGVLLYEGPFLYLSLAILSVWFSVGFAAHLGWFGEDHPFAAVNLRKVGLPKWSSFAFVALFFGTFFLASKAQYLMGGFFRLIGAAMFIQGCITLSQIFERREMRHGARTFIYVVGITLGFYAIVGMGVLSPWLFTGKRRDVRL